MNLWTYRHTHLPASVFLKFGHELLLCEGKVSFQAQLVLFLTIRYSREIKTVIQLCITSWSRQSLLVTSGYCQSRGTTIYHSEWSSMGVEVFIKLWSLSEKKLRLSISKETTVRRRRCASGAWEGNLWCDITGKRWKETVPRKNYIQNW